jgi:DNA gyrase subunit A
MAHPNERILPVLMEDEMRDSYLDYSMSVIVSRALPDARDGLKPVHRRVLYAMYELGMTPNRPYKKSARIVGEVLGKYHPHGDSSVYDAMVRLAQHWSMRAMLVDGQGNFGSVDGDSPAAMRYTEARLSSLAMEVVRDIDKNTVDFRPNFDDSLEEPSVMPTVLPTLLVNGANGIAVGMATNIPPHNLREIVNGIQAVISDPNITNEELLKYVTAPDFPTGGIIYGYEGVRNAYTTGRGKIQVRAKASIESGKTKEAIIITELPYQVGKAGLIEKIADLVKAKTLEDISDIRDESDRDGMRIVIELKRDGVPMVVLNNLYKHTQMQVTFGVIMLALVKGRPRILTLKEMMEAFIGHRVEVIVRRTQFDLTAAEKRAHILEGFIIALDNIDEVIQTIKKSKDTADASANLQSKFGLSEIQAKAILDMRLQRLTGLEREKIQAEYREVIELIERLRAILASKELQMMIIGDELRELALKHGDERRTQVVYDAKDFTLEDFVANEEVIVTISHNGFIKRTPVSTYRRQHKGGRGVAGAGTYEDDWVETVFRASTHHYLLCFTDKGRVYRVKVYDIPEGSRNAKGRSIANVIQKPNDETVNAYLTVTDFERDDQFIFFATKQGTVKKTPVSDFANVRSNGIIAINLDDNDKLIGVRLTDGNHEILIGSSSGLAVHFHESDVRSMGRAAAGVRGISLENDAEVISLVAVRHGDAQVIVVGSRGYGKRTNVDDFRITKRGAKGVTSMNITEKTGKICAILAVTDLEDLVVITTNGILIRQPVKDIRTLGRVTQGVRLIRLEEGDKIADITTVTRDDDDEEEGTTEGGEATTEPTSN